MSFAYRRSRRRPNQLHKETVEPKPFFGKTDNTAIQKKDDAPFFQTRLTVGRPGDKYEKEADAVADHVVNKLNRPVGVQKKGDDLIQRVTLATPLENEKLGTAEAAMERDKEIQEKPELQRMHKDQAEEEEMAQMQPEEEEMTQMQPEEEEMTQMQTEEEEMAQMQPEEEEMMQAKNEGTQSARAATPQLAGCLKDSKGKGRELPKKIRSKLEKAFGADLSKVRIHTDEDAVKMNKKLRAQAFTNGLDIYFNEGKFDPDTTKGKQLLAHELTHVFQQKGK